MIVVSVAFVAIACLLPLSETSKQSGTQRHPETPRETTDSEQHRMTNCMMNQLAHTHTHTLTHYTQECREMHGVYAARFIRSSLRILCSAPVHCQVHMFRLLTQHVSNVFSVFFLMVSRFFSFFLDFSRFSALRYTVGLTAYFTMDLLASNSGGQGEIHVLFMCLEYMSVSLLGSGSQSRGERGSNEM